VLLADDHPALRLGLKVLLAQAPDMEVVGEAERGEDVLVLVEQLRPDVLVLDCEIPGMSGPEVAMSLRERGFETRVIALSAYSDDRYVRGMLEAGAVGYLLKDETPETIVAAVRAAAQGKGYFSPSVAAKVAEWAKGERPGGLTERELEVLKLVAEGLSNKEIAQALRITVRTVDFHLSNILRKLGVASRVEAAMWAKERGLF
jgi:DNA-binding NarL/FixJ family response regulator